LTDGDNLLAPLKNPRWEAFCQQLAGPSPPTVVQAYANAGFKSGDRAHASRLHLRPDVQNRILELQAATGRALAARAARLEVRAIETNVVSRELLLADVRHAYNVAESAKNPAAMIAAVRLLAELSLVSLRCPEDRQPTQHLHVHELVDAPRRESLLEWTQRKRRELDERSGKNPGPNVVKLIPGSD
jgi:hypothetical protein